LAPTLNQREILGGCRLRQMPFRVDEQVDTEFLFVPFSRTFAAPPAPTFGLEESGAWPKYVSSNEKPASRGLLFA
jgi:hypothetical protein